MRKTTYCLTFITIVSLCTFSITRVNAQIQEGTKIFGGTFSFHFETGNDRFDVVPDFSYALKENFTIGGRIGVNKLQGEGVNPVFGVFARKHFFLNDKFGFFGEAMADYRPSYTYDFRIGVLPGLVYFLDPRIGVEWTFGGILYSTGGGNDDQFDISFSPASNSRFGIKYYLFK